MRRRWGRGGLVVFLAGIGLFVAGVAYTGLGLLATPVILAGLLVWGGARWMPRRTAKGTALARRARGFRRFIEEADADRARFAEQKHLFTEYLPYAIVFGCAEKWAKVFAGLDGVVNPEWYVGPRSFTIDCFSDALNRFGSSAGATLAAPAPSSSPWGSSGGSGFDGGFSGGGGGGGDVLSW